MGTLEDIKLTFEGYIYIYFLNKFMSKLKMTIKIFFVKLIYMFNVKCYVEILNLETKMNFNVI